MMIQIASNNISSWKNNEHLYVGESNVLSQQCQFSLLANKKKDLKISTCKIQSGNVYFQQMFSTVTTVQIINKCAT